MFNKVQPEVLGQQQPNIYIFQQQCLNPVNDFATTLQARSLTVEKNVGKSQTQENIGDIGKIFVLVARSCKPPQTYRR